MQAFIFSILFAPFSILVGVNSSWAADHGNDMASAESLTLGATLSQSGSGDYVNDDRTQMVTGMNSLWWPVMLILQFTAMKAG